MRRVVFFDKVCIFLLAGALLLLYWSSDLLERDIKVVKGNVSDMQSDIKELVTLLKQGTGCSGYGVKESLGVRRVEDRDIGDARFPNLLSPDPYMDTTLPSLIGEGFVPKGSLHSGIVGRPDNLSPFNGFESVVTMHELCVPSLAAAHVGRYEKFAPELALKIEERILEESGDKEFHIYLRPGVYWQPINAEYFPKAISFHEMFLKKHPVTSRDFKFFYDVVMNPYVADLRAVALRSCFEDIVSFEIINDLEFVVRWKAHTVTSSDGKESKKVLYSAFVNTLGLQPLPSFVFQYFPSGEKIIVDDEDPDIYRKDSVWAQNFSSHWALNYIVSCGPYVFGGMDKDRIKFFRNVDHYKSVAALVDEKVIFLKDNMDSLFQDFKTGKIDFAYLPPTQKDNLEAFMKSPAYRCQADKGGGIRMVSYSDKAYFYAGWNCFSIFFQERNVRRAMNMAIDRERIIEQVLGGNGFTISGPFSFYSPSYNHNVAGWPYSPEEAARLLEDSGWIDSDGDGIREKLIDGVLVPFRFRLCYYVKSIAARAIAEYVAMACKEIGVDCSLLGLDIADLSKAFEEKNFDAILMSWCLGAPPEDPRALWHSEGALEKGSANAVGFQNSEADAIIEKLSYEYDRDERIKLYHRFHEIIHEEAPYAFLYSRNSVLLYRDYVKNIFVPKSRTDLIPEAQDGVVNLTMVWIDKEGECSSTS